MKIPVRQIPEGGFTDHAIYDPTTLDMDRMDSHVRDPFRVDVAVTKTDQEVIVQATIHCTLHLSCARCLEEFTLTPTIHTMFHYHVAPQDTIDITDDVRQEILLAYPMIPVCQPACRGLCAVCGHNLNTGHCGHTA